MARKPGGAKPVEEEVNVPDDISKAINMAVNLLRSYNVPGLNGEVGNYDLNLVEDCCNKILNEGAVNADTGYGIIINRQYFESAGFM